MLWWLTENDINNQWNGICLIFARLSVRAHTPPVVHTISATSHTAQRFNAYTRTATPKHHYECTRHISVSEFIQAIWQLTWKTKWMGFLMERRQIPFRSDASLHERERGRGERKKRKTPSTEFSEANFQCLLIFMFYFLFFASFAISLCRDWWVGEIDVHQTNANYPRKWLLGWR